MLLRFLPAAIERLSPDGLIYLLLIAENIPLLAVIDKMKLQWTVILKREVIGERQFVIRIRK